MENKKPIRVLRIINRLNLGGPTYNAAFLTKYLAPEYETKLIAGMKDASEAGSEFITQNLAHNILESRNKFDQNIKIPKENYRVLNLK